METETFAAGKVDVENVLIYGKGKTLVAKTSGQITLRYFKSAFNSWYTLGATILHEYYHVADIGSGFASKQYTSMYRKFGNTKKAADEVGIVIEKRAFDFIKNFGATWSEFEDYRHYYGY